MSLDYEKDDRDLAATAANSVSRAPAPQERAQPMATTLGDVLASVARARAAQEAAGIEAEPEDKARGRQLLETLKLLPAVIRKASRAELGARIHPRLMAAINGWKWGSPNLVLSGRTRVGKSSAAGYLVRRLCQDAARHGGDEFDLARSIRWQECRELSEVSREHRLGGGEAPELVMCKHARLLVLDDLGASDDRTTLERILQYRINQGWPTVITTGLRGDGPDGLEKVFGEALTARLFESGPNTGRLVEVFDE